MKIVCDFCKPDSPYNQVAQARVRRSPHAHTAGNLPCSRLNACSEVECRRQGIY